MTKSINILKFLILFGFTILFQSCLKDDEINLVIPGSQNNAILLNYLEVNGNYINSDEMPSIVDVDEVYNNISDYLIIDIRPGADYVNGHISGAVNVQNDSLVSYFNSTKNILEYPKVIITGKDGQAAAYYTSLLRIYGFNNVFSLNFGMALWNNIFSDVWTEQIGNHEIQKHLDGSRLIPGDTDNQLPEIQTNFQQGNKIENVKKLIEKLIADGYNSETHVNLSDSVSTAVQNNSEYYVFRFDSTEISNFYIICYKSLRLYQYLVTYPIPTGHIPGAIFYDKGDFKSSTNLQSLPTNKPIVVYSVSGQSSAFVVAFLRILGYDAKSLNNGANHFYYGRLTYDFDSFTPFVFRETDVRNYPFVTGSSPN